jgi:16S rRNA (uracil1498-N3)-methyltransferase
LSPRIYYPYPIKCHELVTLDEPASRHLLTVLRLRPGDDLQIFNGEGGAFLAKLHTIQKKLAVVAVGDWLDAECESPLFVHLGQGISRGERMDFTVQKSVELGVSQITPLFTQRCGVQLNAERAQNRVQHWRNIAISASEQCGRCQVPKINAPQSFAHFLASATGLKIICTPDQPSVKMQNLEKVSQVCLLIGPEGGFSSEEVDQAIQSGFYAMSLGPRILRTETAAIVTLALLQSLWGDIDIAKAIDFSV